MLTWRFETAFAVRDGGLSEVFILNDRIMPTQLYILYAHFKQKNEDVAEKNEIL